MASSNYGKHVTVHAMKPHNPKPGKNVKATSFIAQTAVPPVKGVGAKYSHQAVNANTKTKKSAM